MTLKITTPILSATPNVTSSTQQKCKLAWSGKLNFNTFCTLHCPATNEYFCFFIVNLPSCLSQKTAKGSFRSLSQIATCYYQSNHSKVEAILLSHLLLDCPTSKSLRHTIFGTTSSIFDLWSRPWGMAQLLGLCGIPPCPYHSEGVGQHHHHQGLFFYHPGSTPMVSTFT